MTSIFEPEVSLSQIKLPPQDIDVLSFCGSNKSIKLKEWVDGLKITQINQTAVMLYNSLPEIAHLKTDANTRFAMLEEFWPVVQSSLEVFSKEFLQQPLILPPKAQKAAIISQALQKHLLDAYTVCSKELIQQNRIKGHRKELLLNCLYRAMSAASLLILRSYQLYTAIPPSLWLRAHSLLQTAEYFDMQSSVVPVSVQPRVAGKTLLQSYTQLLAMGCVRPSQLSQNDLAMTFSALDLWAKHITLFPAAAQDENNPFVINLSKDRGPQEKIRFESDIQDRVFELDFQSVVKQINASQSTAGDTIDNHIGTQRKSFIPAAMSATLVEHILDCWSHSTERKQTRKSMLIKAEACIGIIDCHFHISGKIAFDKFLNSDSPESEESFLSSGFDQFISSLTKNNSPKTQEDEKESIFPVSIQNLSSGGYCLQWKDNLPNRIEAGELIGIREAGRRAWSIGIIRWIRQLKTTSNMGIQILCNQPVPYGATVTLDNGLESDYMRVIHIPSPTMDDQPPSILTTTIPFQAGRRAELKQDDHITPIRLNKSVFSTSKLKLFSFETLAQHDEEEYGR